MDPANRAILLTPPGAAAIAVIRLLGPAVEPFLHAHFSQAPAPARPVHGTLRTGDFVIDDPVVTLSPDRRFADVCVHGGPWVIRSVLDLAGRSGFEVIENAPTPLPPDAVDARDMLEQEVLTHLPLASTEPALRALLNQPAAWRMLLERLPKLADPAAEVRAILADRSLHWLLHPPRVAIVGAPNVGKSTLANRLFAQDRSITADLPGTTRDWVGEIANLDGLAVMLVDTPGLRPTTDAIEQHAIRHSAEQICAADLAVVVLDATRPVDSQLPLAAACPRSITLINKCDRLPASDLPAIQALHVSALTGQGIDALRSAIRSRFDCEPIDPARPRCWTDRQRDILRRAAENPRLLRETLRSEP